MTDRALLVSGRGGEITTGLIPVPDVAAGNAQFFDPDPACLIQLRPLLPADHGAQGAGRGGNALLFARLPSGIDYVCYVRVPPHLRKNNRAGIMCAIERVEHFERSAGMALREVATRTRWPKPVPRTFA